MRTLKWLVGAAAPLLVLPALAHADVGVLSQASALLAEPAPKAAEVAKLPANAPVSIIERKGGFYHVKGPSGEDGWVKLMTVRLTGAPAAAGNADSSGAGAAAARGAAGGSAGDAAAGALGSMMTGSAADSTAVRGNADGKLSGKKLVDQQKAEQHALDKVESFEPSAKDMDDFEKGLEDEGTKK